MGWDKVTFFRIVNKFFGMSNADLAGLGVSGRAVFRCFGEREMKGR
jgi:hypothetical protein